MQQLRSAQVYNILVPMICRHHLPYIAVDVKRILKCSMVIDELKFYLQASGIPNKYENTIKYKLNLNNIIDPRRTWQNLCPFQGLHPSN